MKNWNRNLGLACASLLLLIGLSTLAYLVLVLPNDARMHHALNEQRPIAQFFTLKGSLLGSGMAHHEDLQSAVFAARRDQLTQALPDYAMPASTRFVSPYQIYVPLGSYPLKLDAQDGLYLPNGATLAVSPGFGGALSLRFAAFSPQSAATLSYQVEGTNQSFKLDLPNPPNPAFDASSQFYKNIGRFIEVDPLQSISTWSEVKQDVELGPAAKLSFTCTGAIFGCIIGDLQFYEAQAAAPHNFVIVLVDTLRGDAISAGNAPHMHDLATQSVNFVNALAPGNMTSPSTNALLSCRRPSQLGELAFAYGMTSESREGFYRTRQPSFPARFLQAGYDTAMIGNISVISEIYGAGISHGFARQIALETDGYDTPAIAREAAAWLGQHGDHNFLLYLHFNGPHAPYRAPLLDIIHTFPGFSALRSYAGLLKWLYQSEVAYTDRYLDLVLQSVARLGLAANTMIVLTADHGDQHNDHRFLGNEAGPDFTGAYFDHGATLLNDEIHVPLMIRGPGLMPRRISEYVSTLDLGPTLLDLANHDPAKGCATESLTPYLRGLDSGSLSQRVLGSEGFRGRAILFQNRYKYVRTYEPTDKRIYSSHGWSGDKSLFMVAEQLFDLKADPDEEQNLATTAPELLTVAQRTYQELFAIRDGYELVVEAPNEGSVAIDIEGATHVEFEEGVGQVSATQTGVHVSAGGGRRYLLEIKAPLSAVPKVQIGGQPVAVMMTSMRLPLQMLPADLPVEIGGRFTLLEPVNTAVAYVRKIADDGQRNRHMMTGNPAFERVLREWGYLNEK